MMQLNGILSIRNRPANILGKIYHFLKKFGKCGIGNNHQPIDNFMIEITRKIFFLLCVFNQSIIVRIQRRLPVVINERVKSLTFD